MIDRAVVSLAPVICQRSTGKAQDMRAAMIGNHRFAAAI